MDQSVLITANQVNTLGNVPAGTTIANRDPANAIWVSANPNVAPGTGFRVGPYGTLTWSVSQACYAVVDTGAPNVAITLSASVTNPVSPMDVAVATAKQVNSQGIPNVLLGQLVYSSGQTINGPQALIVPVNLSQYASIIVRITTTQKQVADLLWVDSASGAAIVDQQYILNGNAASSTIEIIQTVKSDQLQIGLSHYPDSPSISIYASNRVLPDSIPGSNLSFSATLNQAFTSGVAVDFPGQYVSNGKPLFARFVATGTSTGKLVCNTLDGFGNAFQLTVIDSTIGVTGNDGKDWTGMLLIPPGVCWFSFLPNATFSCVAKIQLIPSL